MTAGRSSMDCRDCIAGFQPQGSIRHDGRTWTSRTQREGLSSIFRILGRSRMPGTLGCPWALVHSVDGGRDDPSPGRLCDDPLATDGVRASCQQHPVRDGHADGSLGLLGSEAAGSHPWSNQRFVAAHCCFH